jgi:hypothetical protein
MTISSADRRLIPNHLEPFAHPLPGPPAGPPAGTIKLESGQSRFNRIWYYALAASGCSARIRSRYAW